MFPGMDDGDLKSLQWCEQGATWLLHTVLGQCASLIKPCTSQDTALQNSLCLHQIGNIYRKPCLSLGGQTLLWCYCTTLSLRFLTKIKLKAFRLLPQSGT